jgi:hypothetical protein
MTSLLGYARTFFIGGTYPFKPEPLPKFEEEVKRFHEMVEDLARHVADTPMSGITSQQLLQGPFSDVMSHIGQLALLRRLAGAPIAPENFINADVTPARLGVDQALPVSPDADWPEKL